jgi:hypothetical protein
MSIIRFILFCIFCFPILANADFIEGDAGHSSRDLRIPEPLLFDLVRPLGTKKGELEINTLAQKSSTSGAINWASEIEYAIADNLAIEFELPAENSTFTDYKIAMQGTIESSRPHNMIHGWQVLSVKNRNSKKYSADALYINGFRLSDAWSTLNMIGVRRSEFGSNGKNIYLLNNSIFYDASRRTTVGLEINSEIHPNGHWKYRVTPQLHYDFTKKMTLQSGFGISKLNERKKHENIFSLRLIYAF